MECQIHTASEKYGDHHLLPDGVQVVAYLNRMDNAYKDESQCQNVVQQYQVFVDQAKGDTPEAGCQYQKQSNGGGDQSYIMAEVNSWFMKCIGNDIGQSHSPTYGN